MDMENGRIITECTKQLKKIFVSLAPYKLFDILRSSQYLINNI